MNFQNILQFRSPSFGRCLLFSFFFLDEIFFEEITIKMVVGTFPRYDLDIATSTAVVSFCPIFSGAVVDYENFSLIGN